MKQARPRRDPEDGSPPGPTLVIYSRRQCHLCDVAMEAVGVLQARLRFAVDVRDVDERPEWIAAHGDEVPVGFIGERKVFKYRVDIERLERALLSGR